MADSSKEPTEGDKQKSDPKTDKLFSKFLSEVSWRFILCVQDALWLMTYSNVLMHLKSHACALRWKQ